MTEIKIKLSSVNEVKDFVNTVCHFECDMDIYADRYIIDAKSIMGIFSLDLSKPLLLKIDSDSAGEVDDIKSGIGRYIISE